MNNEPKVLKCKTCQTSFDSVKTFKEHFASDWHRYNYKRSVISMPPVSKQSFIEKRQAMIQKERAIKMAKEAPKIIECKECKKKFKSESTLSHHLSSKKHFKVMENLRRKQAFKKKKQNEHKFEIQPDLEAKRDILDCLFCNEFSLTWQENIKHMRDCHGFVIPEKRSCLSFTNLIKHLHDQLKTHKSCLICEMKFDSVEAVKSHMRDKSHCRLNDADLLDDLTMYNHLGMNVLKLKKILNRFGDVVKDKLVIENEGLRNLVFDGGLESIIEKEGIKEGISYLEMSKEESEIEENTSKVLDELIDLNSLGDDFEIVATSRSCISFEDSNPNLVTPPISVTAKSEAKDSGAKESVQSSSAFESYTHLNTTQYSNHPFLLTDMISRFCHQNISQKEEIDEPFRIKFLSCDLDIRKKIDFPHLILTKLAKINQHGELVLGDRIYGHRKFQHIYRQKLSRLQRMKYSPNAIEYSDFSIVNTSRSSDSRVRSFASDSVKSSNSNVSDMKSKVSQKVQMKKENKRIKQMQKSLMKLANLKARRVKIKKKH